MTHPSPQPPKRLTRSRDDRVVAGVCGGVAHYLNVDASVVRLATALLTVVTGGATLLLYVVGVLVVPEDDWVGPTPPPAPRQPDRPSTAAPGTQPTDPVWGREGPPWEPPAPGTYPGQDSGSTDPQRPDAR